MMRILSKTIMVCSVAVWLTFASTATAAPLHEIPYDMPLPAPLANSVALTFDDAPDERGLTNQVLDTLREHQLTATFFINSDSHTQIATSLPAQASLRRMLAEGHTLGNHTAQHLELREQTNDAIVQQLDGVQQAVDQILGSSAPHLSLMRAPYGRPLYPHDRLETGDKKQYERVASVLAGKVVHVGWNIDPWDWEAPSADVLVERIEDLLDGKSDNVARRGVILLHANQAVTVEALPRILQLLQQRDIAVVDVESYVKARYGVDSSALVPTSHTAATF